MKKLFALLFLLVAASMLFASGSSESTATTTDSGKVELHLIWWGNQVRNNLTQEVVNLYMEEHPDVIIHTEFADWSSYWDKLAAMAAGGTLPDIIQQDYSYIQQYVENNLLADLTPYIEDGTIDTTNIPQSIIESGSINGKCYAISLGSNAPMLIYDVATVEAAGVEIPEQMTMEEFLEIGNEIYEKTGVYTYFSGNILTMQIVCRALGSHFFDDIVSGNTEGITRLYQYVKDFQSAPSAVSISFLTERDLKVLDTDPIVDGTCWNTMLYSNMYSSLSTIAGRELGVAMFPQPEDASVQSMFLKPSQFFSITETSQHKKEAAEFIDWFTNSVEANEILMGERGVPINTAVTEAIIDSVSPEAAVTFEFINKAGEIATPIDEPDPAGKSEIEYNLELLTEEIRYGGISPEDAASELIRLGQRILANS